MTQYPLTFSLATVVVLVASCSIPALKDEAPHGPMLVADAASTAVPVPFDFHRVPSAAVCPPGGCWRPTRKTLAVEVRASEDLIKPAQLAVANLLSEPHAVAATATGASRPASAAASEKEFSVYFGYANAALTHEARTTLDEALRDRDGLRRVAIRGRTDGQGASPANQRLALARANAVRQHLLTRDPGLARLLEVEARGSCCYAAPNATPAGRALNRRVEITVVRQDPDA
jgi:outer membrane protein OmpA-like peptidoglycan-associated protein